MSSRSQFIVTPGTKRRAVAIGLATIAISLSLFGTSSGATRNAQHVSPSTQLASKTAYPLPAPATQPPPCPPPTQPPPPPPPPLPPPTVPNSAIPLAKAPGPRHVSLAAITGKGLWITDFPGDSLNAANIVALAKASDLHELFVRTGSSHDGFYAGPLLATLVPLAHHDKIAIIAWDFPTLSNPQADAERAADAFRDGVNAFSPDIEEEPEGTYLSSARVAYYLSLVRTIAGSRPVIATVPRPTSLALSAYPYVAEAPFVDAFAPMVYWSCTEPGAAVFVAIKALRSLRPVAPVGQDYNMASEGGPAGLPSGPEVWRFVDVARRAGAIGVSLYDFESGGVVQLGALSQYPWKNVAVTKTSS